MVDGIELAILVVFKVSLVDFTEDVGEVSFGHVITAVVQASKMIALDCA